MVRIIVLSFLLQGCAVIPVAIPVVLKGADRACDLEPKCKAGKTVAKVIKEKRK